MTASATAVSASRTAWLVVGIVVALVGAGAVTYGVLDGEAPPGPDAQASTSPPRADNHLGFFLGGLLATGLGLVLVYRSTD